MRFQMRSMTPGGDIVTAVDGRPRNDEAELGVAPLRFQAGDAVVLRVYRAGRPRDVTIELGSRPRQSDPALVA